MKIRIVQGVVAATVLSLGALAYGQTSNAIPSEETFEAMTNGQSILVLNNTNGWYGDPTMSAIATNVPYAWAGGLVLHPVENPADHTMVLKFSEASLTNQFETYDTSITATNMTVDFMIKPERSEEAPSSNLVTGSQTALYLDTNGLLNVWYGIDNLGNNAWMTFTNASSLGTSDWARVTIAFDYITDVVDARQYFMVTVNGFNMLPTNNLGYVKHPEGYFTLGGAGDWLITANPTKQIHSFALSGSGMLDDFVITTNAVTNFVAQPAGTYTLIGSAGANGSVSPASTNVPAGGSAIFDVTGDSYYRIASLTNTETFVGIFGNDSTNYIFTWTNVQANGTLYATFTAQVADNSASTPYWWLAQYGLTNFNADAIADQDHDGLQAWQEFIVGTDPTNYASVLRLESVTSDGVNDTITWLSATGSPNYSLFYSLNLTNANNGWTASVNNIVPTPPTNTITIAQPGQPVFYKVTVTN